MDKLKKFVKFGVIGAIGTIVNTAVLFLLVSFAHLYYVLSSIIATEIAIIFNFFGNNFFTFREVKNTSPLFQKFLKFQVISLITVIGTTAILALLTETFGITYLVIWNITAIFIMFLFNFLLNSSFTWKEKKEKIKIKPLHFLPILLVLFFLLILDFSSAQISVSQLGYHPSSYKQAIVYLDTESDFVNLVSSSGNVMGRYALQNARDYFGNTVNCQGNQQCRIIDFSDFSQEGTYYFETDLGAKSPRFKISKAVFSDNIPVLLDFFEAQQQQNSGYHPDFHTFGGPRLTTIADGSFIMETDQASIPLIHLANAYRKNPNIFKNTKFPSLAKNYLDYIISMQGIDIQERTDGIGFRLNQHLEPLNVFVPGKTNLTQINVYIPSSGNPPRLLKALPVVSLCGSLQNQEYQQCIENAGFYYKCQENEPCLNLSYQDKTGIFVSSGNNYLISKGWSYEFACYLDIDLNEKLFDANYNPCLYFNTETSLNSTIKALAAFLESQSFVNDYYPSESQNLLARSISTYNFIKSQPEHNLGEENAGYYGVSSFLLYDYTNDTDYLNEAYNLRNRISSIFIADEPRSNDLYWEQYIIHKKDIISLNRNFNINGISPESFYRNSVFGDYKDRDSLSISKTGERVFQLDNNIQFQNSRYMLLESLFAAKSLNYYNASESFIFPVALNQVYWLTGMNLVQDGIAKDSPLKSYSFIFGIGENPKYYHSRYLVNTGLKKASNSAIIGVRGTNLQFFNGTDYIYFDGVTNILGSRLGGVGNLYQNESQTLIFLLDQKFNNGKDFIPGWITGVYPVKNSGNPDNIFNYDDNVNSWQFTETENRIVSLAVENFAYLDSIVNLVANSTQNNTEPYENNTKTNYTLSVNSEPSGSYVFLNNIFYGLTPATLNIFKDNYNLAVVYPGYISNKTAINLNKDLDFYFNLKNLTNLPRITSDNTDLIMENSYYKIYETDSGSFELATDRNADIVWSLDGKPVLLTSGTSHKFNWTPDIFFTANVTLAVLTASTSKKNVSWQVNVYDLIQPYFETESGTSTTLHVITSDILNLTHLSVIINNSNAFYNFSLNPVVRENNTDWQLANSFVAGENYLHSIIGKDQNNNTFNIDLLKEIKFSNVPIQENDAEDSSSSSSASSGDPIQENLNLIYVVLDKNIAFENEPLKITLDAKSTRSINSAEAYFLNLNSSLVIELFLVKGDSSYGTWSATFNASLPGLYKLQKIRLVGESKSQDFLKTDREFYINKKGDELQLVNSFLDRSIVNIISNITLSLDASDEKGITSINATIEVKKGSGNPDFLVIPLSRSSGTPKYGTWKGSFMVNKSDTTYTIRNVTLYNIIKSKTYQIQNRSVYATPLLPEPIKEKTPLNFLTGGIIGVIGLRNPFTPFVIAILIIILIMVIIYFSQKLSGRVRKKWQK